MRICKILFLVALVTIMTGCSCRTRSVEPGDANIPVAGEGDILSDINFAFDKYDITETAKGILQGHAAWLQSNPNAKVTIEGHTDERGTNEYNMVLGANRANATKDYLRSLGIDGTRMSTISYGEELPLDPQSNEEAWARNRRAHFVVE